MKRYSDNPLNVRLHQVQEQKLNEMMNNPAYCQSKGLFSKADVVRNSINNVLKDYDRTTQGNR